MSDDSDTVKGESMNTPQIFKTLLHFHEDCVEFMRSSVEYRANVLLYTLNALSPTDRNARSARFKPRLTISEDSLNQAIANADLSTKYLSCTRSSYSTLHAGVVALHHSRLRGVATQVLSPRGSTTETPHYITDAGTNQINLFIRLARAIMAKAY